MTTVHLTDDQHAQFTATGLIVVDGEAAIPPFMDDKGDNPWSDAPELWRKLTDPCPTCCRVVTLIATCGVCDGRGGDDDRDCWNCADGVLPLGRFTIRLLPVVAGQWAVHFEAVE